MSDLEPQRRKFQKELSAGTVSLVLLSVLGQAPEPLYGYQIAKRLEREGAALFGGKQSALYPVLRNLDAAGLLASDIEPSVAGPPRRYYRLTEPGDAALATFVQDWTRFRDSVDAILDGRKGDGHHGD